jgi:hypothetical protein
MPKAGTLDKYIALRPAQGSGGAFRVAPYPVAASQTIRRGDIVALSSGSVQQAIALPGANNTATASGGNLAILGVALDDITTNASGVDTTSGGSAGIPRTHCNVAIFDDNLEVAMRLYDATLTNTQQSDVTVGTAYQFARFRGASASEWWYMLTITTTNGELKVVERSLEVPGSALTDNYGILWTRAALSATVRQLA